MSRDEWKLVKLGDLLTRRKDFVPIEAGIDYPISGVQRSGWGLVQKDPVNTGNTNFKKLLKLEEGDFVYRTITAFEAPSTVVFGEFVDTFVTPQAFPVFKVDQQKIKSDFLKLITTWEDFHFEMASRCVGTVLRRKTLSVKALNEIPLNLPPLEVQRQIVAVMQSIDQAISDQEAHVEATEKVRENTLHALLTEGGDDWEETTLGESVEINPKTEKLTPESPFVAMADVDTWGTYAFPSEVKGTRGGIRAQGGDVLMARITPCLENGKIGIVPEEFGAVGGSTEFIVLRDGDKTVPGFAFLLTQSSHVHQSAIRLMVGTSGRQRVSHKDVREIAISLPPLETQQHIVEVMQSIDSHLADARNQLESMRKLRGEVLNALLSGEHEIPAEFDPSVRQ